MSNIKYILGHFEDPDDLMHGIDKLQESDISIYDVFTPMPIHGIEDKLGVKRSRLGKVAFGVLYFYGGLMHFQSQQHLMVHSLQDILIYEKFYPLIVSDFS